MRVLVAAIVSLWAPPVFAADPLPEGDQGIAANYPNDGGIGDDPAVLLVEDFESYTDATQLWDAWDNVFQQDLLFFATAPDDVWAGAQSLEMRLPQQEAELGNALAKIVAPERDVLFLRYYSKFMGPFDVIGSSHNGSWISSHYEDENGQATPGVPADGTNKFLVAYENWRGEAMTPSPGHLNVYVYHPEQRDIWGDHFFPTGLVSPNTSLPFDFGPDFVPREDVIPALDRWYCFEVMVQANTPGQRDGRIAFWLDGVLAADFTNLRLRDVAALTIDRFGVGFHIGSNPMAEQRKWYDNVVAADSYIGPMFVPGGGTGGDSDGTGGAEDPTGGGDGTGASGPSSATDAGTASATADDAGGSGESGGGAAQGGSEGCGCTTGAPAPWLWAIAWLPASRRRRT